MSQGFRYSLNMTSLIDQFDTLSPGKVIQAIDDRSTCAHEAWRTLDRCASVLPLNDTLVDVFEELAKSHKNQAKDILQEVESQETGDPGSSYFFDYPPCEEYTACKDSLDREYLYTFCAGEAARTRAGEPGLFHIAPDWKKWQQSSRVTFQDLCFEHAGAEPFTDDEEDPSVSVEVVADGLQDGRTEMDGGTKMRLTLPEDETTSASRKRQKRTSSSCASDD